MNLSLSFASFLPNHNRNIGLDTQCAQAATDLGLDNIRHPFPLVVLFKLESKYNMLLTGDNVQDATANIFNEYLRFRFSFFEHGSTLKSQENLTPFYRLHVVAVSCFFELLVPVCNLMSTFLFRTLSIVNHRWNVRMFSRYRGRGFAIL